MTPDIFCQGFLVAGVGVGREGMRADRLISIVMILQARGRATARELAAELGVSERTIYRDVDALSAAGVPIYGESGPEGGYALLDSYRTDLTGLSEQEVRALFMLDIPAPLDELGMAQSLKAALLKLAAAVSSHCQDGGARVRQRFYIDAIWWQRGEESGVAPALQALQRAVWDDHLASIRFTIPPLSQEVEHVVAPYALVSKAGTWYLVYGLKSSTRAIRVHDLLAVRVLDGGFERPDSFDLVAFWQAWCAHQEHERQLYEVEVLVTPNQAPWLRHRLSAHLCDVREPVNEHKGTGKRRIIRLAFGSLEEARARLLPLGSAVEVVSPRALRLSIADYGRRIAALYGDGPG
jgi:predicted DNA-binding transcriptional regulator YafY